MADSSSDFVTLNKEPLLMKNKTCTFFLTMFLLGALFEPVSASDMSVWQKYASSKRIETTPSSGTSISAPSGMTREKATTLLKQQKWAQAQSAYTDLFILFPEDMSIIRGLAKAAKGNRDYSRAMIFFEQLTVHFPSDVKVWQDLADVYTALGNSPAARYAMNRADALREKSGTAKKSSLFTVRSWLGAGAFYDDNVFFQPAKKSIRVGNRTFDLRDKKHRAKKSSGGYARAALSMDRQLQPKGPWSVVAEASGRFRYYFNEPDAVTTSARVAAGLRYASPDHQVTVRGKLEQYTEDFKNEFVQFGGEAVLSNRISSSIYLQTRGSLAKREYQDISSHDATYGWIGEYARFFWKDNELMIGGRLIDNNASEKRYSYTGWQISAMTSWAFTENINLRLTASFENRNYDKPSFQWLAFDRKDEKTRLTARLRYSFTEALSLEIGYSYLHSNSNTDIFDYAQNVFNMGISWEF